MYINSKSTKKLIDYEPFGQNDQQLPWDRRGIWPASWISGSELRNDCSIAYRNKFTIDKNEVIRIHVTADARYRLYLDGNLCGVGPELGDAHNWFFDTYELELTPGSHVLLGVVVSCGELAPTALISVQHGFLLAAEGKHEQMLSTGIGNWQCHKLAGLKMTPSSYWIFNYMGGVTHFDCRKYPAGVEKGESSEWTKPAILYPGVNADSCNEYSWRHLLRRGTLPEKINTPISGWRICQVSNGLENFWSPSDEIDSEHLLWQQLEYGASVTIPAQCQRRVLIDLDNYYCAFPSLNVSGGKDAVITLGWAESLFLDNNQAGAKGDRREWENRYFIGLTDVFIADGGTDRQFFTHWWRAGRYLMLTVETSNEPISINAFELNETRYPLIMENSFRSSDEKLNWLVKPCLRTLQMCSHDTFMDCPYYEQLMYVGDTRLQALVTHVVSTDSKLVKKALRLFAYSRLNSGFLQSRYPSKKQQLIPPFSLSWIEMLHDFVFWRDEEQLGRELLPIAKGIIDAFDHYRNSMGLIESLRSWNFVDWAEPWHQTGVPPEGEAGISSVINWMLVCSLTKLAELCQIFNEFELAMYYHQRAEKLAEVLIKKFWDAERGLFADTLQGESFSEHAQCLAILSGLLPEQYRNRLETTLFNTPELTCTTVYFSHYLFEAYRALGRGDAIQERLAEWFNFQKYHLYTLLERPEPSRSDCHAWSSHPLFHYFATILGIRPAEAGFKSVFIAPQLGSLEWVEGELPHIDGGMIKVCCRQANGIMRVEIKLPLNVPASFRYGNYRCKLEPGRQHTMSLDLETGMPVKNKLLA